MGQGIEQTETRRKENMRSLGGEKQGPALIIGQNLLARTLYWHSTI